MIAVDDILPSVLTWADPAKLAEGQHILGLGYPVPATDFSAQPGSILSFQTSGPSRQAIRTNAPLDHGDSGGPALTDSGQVVGVMTELADNSNGVQTVPLIFTQDAVGSTVANMIASPGEPQADCSSAVTLPPLPPDWTPPTFTMPTYPPVTYPDPPTYTIPTTTTLPCPTGAPSVTVTSVTATPESGLDGYWNVDVTGRVVNNASATIDLSGINVTIDGSPPSQTYGSTNSYSLRAGEATTWTAHDFMQSSTQPASATAQMASWSWDDYQFSGCGTG